MDITQKNIYPIGNFNFITSYMNRTIMCSAFNAINNDNISNFKNNWDVLRTNKPPPNSSFMFWDNPPKEIKHIMDVVEKNYPGHSGMSFGWTMRQLQYIAINGWDEYVKMYTTNI